MPKVKSELERKVIRAAYGLPISTSDTIEERLGPAFVDDLMRQQLAETEYFYRPAGYDTGGKFHEASRIFWPTKKEKEIDFGVFDRIIQETAAHPELSDDEYAELSTRMMQEFIHASKLFWRLSQVKSANNAESVSDHILSVIRRLKTENLSLQEVVVVRVAAWLHDLGKVMAYKGNNEHNVIAGDYAQIHARLSRQFADIYFLNKKRETFHLFPKLQDSVRQLVRYHHIYQLLDDGDITYNDFASIVPKKDKHLLDVLSYADVTSVPAYVVYALDNLYQATLAQQEEQIHETLQTDGSVELEASAASVIIQLIRDSIELMLARINHLMGESNEAAFRLLVKLKEHIERLIALPLLSKIYSELSIILQSNVTPLLSTLSA